MVSQSEIPWEEFQFPNIPLYRAKLPDYVMDYLWSVTKKAEEDNVDNSNDYSHRLAGNITGSLGLVDVDDYFLKTVVGPMTTHIVNNDPKNFAPPVDFELREKFKADLSMNCLLYTSPSPRDS